MTPNKAEELVVRILEEQVELQKRCANVDPANRDDYLGYVKKLEETIQRVRGETTPEPTYLDRIRENLRQLAASSDGIWVLLADVLEAVDLDND